MRTGIRIDTTSPVFHAMQAVGGVLPTLMLWIAVGSAVGIVVAIGVAGTVDFLTRRHFPRAHGRQVRR